LNLSLLSKSPPTEGDSRDTEVQRCGCCRGLIRHISALHFGFDFDAHMWQPALQQEVGEALGAAADGKAGAARKTTWLTAVLNGFIHWL
jgi:hypothetical protein